MSTSHLWFMNTLVQIRVASSADTDELSVIEHTVAHRESPPLHSHVNEVEFFHILEGEFRFQLNGTQQRAGPGAMLLVPKGAVHTYFVESKTGGRFVTVTRGGDFERFIRTISRPADRPELPAPSGPPDAAAQEAFGKIAAAHGIIIHGPPLH